MDHIDDNFENNNSCAKRVTRYHNFPYGDIIQSTYLVNNGKLDGELVNYNKSGYPILRENYVNGILINSCTYYDEYAIKEEKNYKFEIEDDGKTEEVKKFNYSGTTIYSHSIYSNNKGEYEKIVNGILIKKKVLNADKSLKCYEYYDKGQKWKEYTEIDGWMVGDYIEYHTNNNIKRQCVYGKMGYKSYIISGKMYHETGVFWKDIR